MLLTTVPNCAAGWRIAAAASSSPTARTESSLIRSMRLPIGGAISSNGHSVGSRTFDAWPRAMTGSMKPLSPPSASPPLLLTSSSSQMSLRPSYFLAQNYPVIMSDAGNLLEGELHDRTDLIYWNQRTFGGQTKQQ